jgi:heme exporter protein C
VRNTLAVIFLGIALVMFGWAPFMIEHAPFEASMGAVSKIFYFHAPSAMVLLLSAFVAGGASVAYLIRRRRLADHIALAAAELAIVFGIITLVTGPMWARKAWGVWWVWEARLTITLVMWMVFIAYLLLRRFGGTGSEMLAAAVSVFGMALVPFVYWSVNVWRTMHPTTSVIPSLPPSMRGPFWFCVGAFVCLYVALLLIRVRLEQNAAALEDAYLALEE